MQINPQYESYYGSLYHKIQNDSTEFRKTVTSLLDTMKQTNMIIETEIDYLKSVSIFSVELLTLDLYESLKS